MSRRSRRKGGFMTFLIVAAVGVVVFMFHDKLRLLLGKVTGMFGSKQASE